VKLADLFSPADVARLRVPAVLLVVVLLAGVLSPGTWSFTATFAITQALLALSVGMLFGRAGLLSLCPLAFAAISAWVVLWFNVNAKLPFFVMLLIGVAAAIPAGLLVGGLAVRVRGVNLAIVTLAFGAAVAGVLSLHPFPGTLDAEFRSLRPVGFTGDRAWFVMAFAILLAVGVGLEALGRTRVGQAWLAVRSSERAAAAAGLSVPVVKLSAFIVSAAIAGLAGGLYAAQLQGSIDARSFGTLLSLGVVAAAVMFGAQSLSGALFAGVLAAVLPEAFRRLGWSAEYPQILFGLGAIQALSQGSGGIASNFPWRQPIRSQAESPPVGDRLAATPSSAATLDIDGLTVRYGKIMALDSVSVSVPAATVVGVIGPNGAGKSTLVDAVCGFIDEFDGEISLDGRRIDQLSATKRARAGIRRTFQQGRAVAELTVGDFVRLYSSGQLSDGELDSTLGYFGLPPADQPISFVDVGTRRVLEVAACVAARPSVVFLDEPAAGLGAEETDALAEQIRGIPEFFGCSAVLIEHDVDMVANVCSEITVLDFGRVIASGTPEEVLADDTVQAAYLGVDVADGAAGDVSV
jgi:branched-chain amino acid transport system permease protein